MYNFVQALSKSLSVREDFSEGFFRVSGFRGSGFGGLGAQDFRGWGFRVWGPGLQGLGCPPILRLHPPKQKHRG